MSLDNKIKIICSGEDSSNHPQVFITFKRGEDTVKCGYCGKIFKKSDYLHDDDFSDESELKIHNEKKSV
jgi:uncharacterized Zn-finger protein